MRERKRGSNLRQQRLASPTAQVLVAQTTRPVRSPLSFSFSKSEEKISSLRHISPLVIGDFYPFLFLGFSLFCDRIQLGLAFQSSALIGGLRRALDDLMFRVAANPMAMVEMTDVDSNTLRLIGTLAGNVAGQQVQENLGSYK